VGDNLDGVDVDTTAADLGLVVFFSPDSGFPDFLEPFPPVNSGTALANGYSGGDVLFSGAGGVPLLAIPALLFGLDLLGFDTDDLDALAFDDADGSLSLTAVDTIYFSVRRGSAVMGAPDSLFGIPIEEGDILTLPRASASAPFAAAPPDPSGATISTRWISRRRRPRIRRRLPAWGCSDSPA
jgi:hypothetical protein